MLKGILEGCLLSIIDSREVYGYELYSILAESGFEFVSEGSIYPLLLRMQKEQWITGYMKAADKSGGPPRKYYRLTPEGELVLQQFQEHWKHLKISVDHVLSKGDGR
ncbi:MULTISPECIES: PadR family transcriptional regulator [Paenibacillus]|uniref:PadR family transcriptional regulator n=1 Tax=Paenibacillus TaxID=44249 RepID=UPI0022B9202D|nr:PadR family transcriptional regulator [Paenibacillus caseinilyticus]MCZ8521255.1 PadR family transcriptional regulator [Paenibacillus caseinilyticus]